MSEIKYSVPASPFVALVAPLEVGIGFKAAIFPIGTAEPTPCTFIAGTGTTVEEFKQSVVPNHVIDVQPLDIVWPGGEPKTRLLGEDAVAQLLGYIRGLPNDGPAPTSDNVGSGGEIALPPAENPQP